MACSGLSNDIQALDALAKSGALDAFLPIAKAFKDRGDTALLVRLLVRLSQGYDATIRPYEPDLALFLDGRSLPARVGVERDDDGVRTVITPGTSVPGGTLTIEAATL